MHALSIISPTPVQLRRQQAGGDVGRKRQRGDIDAMALLSQIHFTQGDYAQAKALAQQATIAGSKRGAIMLARVLVNTGGKTDYPQAIKLLQTATEDIDNDSAVDAQMLLGLIYANGVEVARTMLWRHRGLSAAHLCHALAMPNTGQGCCSSRARKALSRPINRRRSTG